MRSRIGLSKRCGLPTGIERAVLDATELMVDLTVLRAFSTALFAASMPPCTIFFTSGILARIDDALGTSGIFGIAGIDGMAGFFGSNPAFS